VHFSFFLLKNKGFKGLFFCFLLLFLHHHLQGFIIFIILQGLQGFHLIIYIRVHLAGLQGFIIFICFPASRVHHLKALHPASRCRNEDAALHPAFIICIIFICFII